MAYDHADDTEQALLIPHVQGNAPGATAEALAELAPAVQAATAGAVSTVGTIAPSFTDTDPGPSEKSGTRERRNVTKTRRFRFRSSSSKSSLKAKKAQLELPERDLASFLGDFPDDRALSDFLLPGTHDSLAYYGYPIAQCQAPRFPLEVQLENGVRVLDIRLGVINGGQLIAFHGIISQRVAFTTVLTVIERFLQQHPTECVVMSIKQEDYSKNPAKVFSTLLKQVVYSQRSLWYLDDRIPTIGEVRGKIVMLSRFGDAGAGWPGGDAGIGIHPTRWPDSLRGSFDWYCDGTRVEMQDWYAIPSFLAIPEKFEIATVPLVQSSYSSHPHLPRLNLMPPLAVSFTSASSFPLALPPWVALGFGVLTFRRWWWGRVIGWAGMNERIRNWLEEFLTRTLRLEDEARGEKGSTAKVEERIRGWVLMDYVDTPDDMLPLLIECNYH